MYLRLDPVPRWLDVERGLAACNLPDTEKGRKLFDEFVREAVFDDEERRQFKVATHREVYRAALPNFADDGSNDWHALKKAIAQTLSVHVDEVLNYRRPTNSARKLFILAARTLGASQAAIGAQLGVSAAAVSAIMTRNLDEFDALRPQVGCCLQHFVRACEANESRVEC